MAVEKLPAQVTSAAPIGINFNENEVKISFFTYSNTYSKLRFCAFKGTN